VRVATFNINNINKRLDNLLAWLAKTAPDVVSLQELKAEQEAFPVNALRTLGYEAVWQGERSWNGVAILARNHVPVLTCTSLPGNPEDRHHEDQQARYIEAVVQGVLITSTCPMGIRSPDRNSITSWPGLSASLPTPPNSWRLEPPWYWPVTTTSCQLRRTSIRLDCWITTR
jgi:exonuclease III